jgi:hypothetical protein
MTNSANSDVKRSSVYHLLNTIAPSNHKLKAELDFLGCTAIAGVALLAVAAVRLLVLWILSSQ